MFLMNSSIIIIILSLKLLFFIYDFDINYPPDPYKVRIGGIFKISVFIYSIYLIIPDNLYKVVGYFVQIIM